MPSVADQPGTDPTLPNVPIILGGVERHLVYDHNSIVLAERETGINLLKAIIQDVDATKLRGLLWASLLKESPDLTVEQVGRWITPANANGIHQCLILAWFGSIPTKDAKDDSQGEATAQVVPTA